MENFKLFLSNLSDTYIFSLVTIFITIIVMIFVEKTFRKIFWDKKTDLTNQDDQSNLTSDDGFGGIVSKIKSARVRELEEALTEEQKQEERRIEREQLAAIYELLKTQEAELNTNQLDFEELNQQLNLYR